MNSMISFASTTISFAFPDSLIFWLIQILIIGVSTYAFIIAKYISYKNKKGSLNIRVIRGEKSKKYFSSVAPFVITTFLITIFTITEVASGYKIFLFTLDFGSILYLSFCNNWSRNKIVGFVSKIEDKIEE